MDTANNNAQQPQPLWARSQIDDFIQRTVGKEDIRTPEDAVRYACSAAHVIACDLHARIQELERELAEARSQRWDPVEDGEYVHDSIIDGRIVVRVEDNGKTVQINDTDGYGAECIHLDGTEYRLCRLAPHAQEEASE